MVKRRSDPLGSLPEPGGEYVARLRAADFSDAEIRKDLHLKVWRLQGERLRGANRQEDFATWWLIEAELRRRDAAEFEAGVEAGLTRTTRSDVPDDDAALLAWLRRFGPLRDRPDKSEPPEQWRQRRLKAAKAEFPGKRVTRAKLRELGRRLGPGYM